MKALSKRKAEAIYKAAGLDADGKCFCALCQKTRMRELWNFARRGLAVLSLIKRS